MALTPPPGLEPQAPATPSSSDDLTQRLAGQLKLNLDSVDIPNEHKDAIWKSAFNPTTRSKDFQSVLDSTALDTPTKDRLWKLLFQGPAPMGKVATVPGQTGGPLDYIPESVQRAASAVTSFVPSVTAKLANSLDTLNRPSPPETSAAKLGTSLNDLQQAPTYKQGRFTGLPTGAVEPPPSGPPKPTEAGTLDVLGQLPQNIWADVKPQDIYGSLVKMGAGLIKGISLGYYDPDAGTFKMPVTGTKYQLRDRTLSQTLQDDWGVSPEIAQFGAANSIGNVVGTTVPWSAISRTLSGAVALTQGASTQALAESGVPQKTIQTVSDITKEILGHAGIQAATGAIYAGLEAPPDQETQQEKAKRIGETALYGAGFSVLFDSVARLLGALPLGDTSKPGFPKTASETIDKVRNDIYDIFYRSGRFSTEEQARAAADRTMKSTFAKYGHDVDQLGKVREAAERRFQQEAEHVGETVPPPEEPPAPTAAQPKKPGPRPMGPPPEEVPPEGAPLPGEPPAIGIVKGGKTIKTIPMEGKTIIDNEIVPSGPTVKPEAAIPPPPETTKPVDEIPENKDVPSNVITPNKGDMVRGSSNIPLSEHGRQQVAQLAEDIQKHGGLDGIWSSNLDRAMETAQAITNKSSNPTAGIRDTGALHPWHLGGLEGQASLDILEKMNHLITNEPDTVPEGRGPRSASDGESFNQFKARVLGFFGPLMDQLKPGQPLYGRRIGVVTHFRDLKLLQAWTKAGTNSDLTIDNKEMLRKDGEPGTVARLYLNDKGDWQVDHIDISKGTKPLDPGIYIIRHGNTEWNGENKPVVSKEAKPAPTPRVTPPPETAGATADFLVDAHQVSVEHSHDGKEVEVTLRHDNKDQARQIARKAITQAGLNINEWQASPIVITKGKVIPGQPPEKYPEHTFTFTRRTPAPESSKRTPPPEIPEFKPIVWARDEIEKLLPAFRVSGATGLPGGVGGSTPEERKKALQEGGTIIMKGIDAAKAAGHDPEGIAAAQAQYDQFIQNRYEAGNEPSFPKSWDKQVAAMANLQNAARELDRARMAPVDKPAEKPKTAGKTEIRPLPGHDIGKGTAYGVFRPEGQVGTITTYPRGDDAVQVSVTSSVPDFRGKGYFADAYRQLANEITGQGKELWSDTTVTPDAARLYESLKRSGFNVEKNPNVTIDKDGDLSAGEEPVFKVSKGKKASKLAPPPEASINLPQPPEGEPHVETPVGNVPNPSGAGVSTEGTGLASAGGSEGVRGVGDSQRPDEGVLNVGAAQPRTPRADAGRIPGRGATGGRYSLIGKPPIALTKSERLDINDRVRKLVDEKQPGDPLSDEEKNLLRQYTGHGGLGEETQGILFEHYTSYKVVKFHWDKLKSMGYPMEGATVLEPAGAIGNYVGFAPPEVNMHLVEIDPTAAKVAKLLYPDVKVSNMPFEDYAPRGLFDIVISNVPFADSRGKLRFQKEAEAYKDITTLHDFFFMKSLDLTKPNGIVSFISSTGTMDKQSEKVRRLMNEKAEFLGAYRTPGGEFQKNTQFGGSVDIIFLRKRTPEEIATLKPEDLQKEWVNSTQTDKFSKPGQPEANLSTYYMENPQQAWGQMQAGYNVRQVTRIGVKPTAPIESFMQIAMADPIKWTPKETQSTIQSVTDEERNAIGVAPKGLRPGSLVMHAGGQIGYVDKDGNLYEANFGKNAKGEPSVRGATLERVKDSIDIMNDAEQLYSALKDNAIDRADMLRKALTLELDKYQKTYGRPPGYDNYLWRFINGGTDANPLAFADPRVWLMAGLTDENGKLSDIFRNNTIYVPPKQPRSYNPTDLSDVAKFVYEETGTFNLHEIASLYRGAELDADGVTAALVGTPGFSIEDLTADGKPTVQIDDEYLFGSLWPKIDQTQAMMAQVEQNPTAYSDQIKQTLATQERNLYASLPEQATVETMPKADLFASWMDDGTVNKWLQSFGVHGTKEFDYASGRNKWSLYGNGKLAIPLPDSPGNNYTGEEIQSYLNHERATMKVDTGRTDERGRVIYKTVFDLNEQKRLNRVGDNFAGFIAAAPQQIAHLVPVYNRAYRSFNRRIPSDQEMRLDGLSAIFKGKPLIVNPHQWEVDAMMLHQRSGINAHGVGGGKTMSGIMLMQLAKQRGLINKPIVVVPAKVIKNWGFEINQLFPQATVLDLSNLTAKNRYKVLQRAAATNADYILMTYNGFKEIPLRVSEQYMEEDLRQFHERLLAAHKANDKRTETMIQNQIRKYEEKLAKLQDMKKTNTIFFEDIGVDSLLIDEFHNHKNLPQDYGDMKDWLTAAGYSQQAADMAYKTRYIHESRGGRKGQNVWGLTATPTPNNPIEIYGMMKYIAPGEWIERNIQNAGDFVEQFGIVDAIEEASTTGVPRTRTVFKGYKNLRDLRSIFRRYIDLRPTSAFAIKRPEAEYTDHFILPTPEVIFEAGRIAELDAYVREHPKEAQLQKLIPLSVLTMARKLAGDIAILNPIKYRDTLGRKGSKIDALMEDLKRNDDGENTQLIFIDLYRAKVTVEVGAEEEEQIRKFLAGESKDLKGIAVEDDLEEVSTDGENSDITDEPEDKERGKKKMVEYELVNLHKAVRDKLIAAGIPEDQIAILNQASNSTPTAKFKVQKLNAEGKLRFLIGTTPSMGEGMNLQSNTTDVYHYDVPWTPAALEQREGRAVRQGNIDKATGLPRDKVRIHRYIGKGTSDAKMYAILSRKAEWNRELWSGESDEVTDFDQDGKNYADISADAQISQKVLDYWQTARRIKLGEEQLPKLKEHAEEVQESVNDIQKDIDQRLTRIKEYEAKINRGAGTDFDRARIESHRSNIETLESQKKQNESVLAASWKRYNDAKGELDKDLETLKQVVREAKQEGLPVLPEHEHFLTPDLLPPVGVARRLGMPPAGAAMSEAGARGTTKFADEAAARVRERMGELNPPIGATIQKTGAPPGMGGPPAPETFETGDPEIDGRLKAAAEYESPKKSLWDQVKTLGDEVLRKVTRTFQYLPDGRRFGPVIDRLVIMSHGNEIAKEKALLRLQDTLYDLGADPSNPRHFNFVVELALKDMLAQFGGMNLPSDQRLPFGFTVSSLRSAVDAIVPINRGDGITSQAIERHLEHFNEVRKNYGYWMQKIGWDIQDRLKEDYFHRQVISKMEEKRPGSSQYRLQTPTGRSYMRARVGPHEEDFSLNYLESAYEVLMGMEADINTAKLLDWIIDPKNGYNLAPSIKKMAIQANERAVMDLLEEMGTVEDPAGYLRGLGRKQAIGFERLGKLAYDGQLPDTPDKRWSPVIEALANNYGDNLERKAELGEEWTPDDRQLLGDEQMGGLMAYASWLAKQTDEEAAGTAKLIWKGIQEKRAAIKKKLGENFLRWQDLADDIEGFTRWQPRPGNTFFTVYTVQEQVAQAVMEGTVEELGIKAEDIRTMLARGGPFKEIVIPTELANTLNELRPALPNSVIPRTARQAVNVFKTWELMNPWKAVKFAVRIASEQGKIWTFYPKALMEYQKAASDLYQVLLGGRPITDPIMQQWFNRGGFMTMLQVRELGDINQLEIFAKAMAEVGEKWYDHGPVKAILNAGKQYFKGTRALINYISAVGRYSVFRAAVNDITENGIPSNFAASNPMSVLAPMNDKYDMAAKIANELSGPYDRVSQLNRDVVAPYIVPFAKFHEANMSTWVGLLRNALNDVGSREFLEKIGREIQKTAPQKLADAAGGQRQDGWYQNPKASRFLNRRMGYLFLMFTGLGFTGLAAWNRFVNDWLSPGSDDEQPDYVKYRPHLTLPIRINGKAMEFPGLGTLSEFLSWFGMDASYGIPAIMISHVFDGKLSLTEGLQQYAAYKWWKIVAADAETVAKQGMPVGSRVEALGKMLADAVVDFPAVRHGVGLVNPLIKAIPEMGLGREFGQEPGQISPTHGLMEYAMRHLALGDEYKLLTGQKSPAFYAKGIPERMIATSVVQGESDYFAARQLVFSAMKDMGKESPPAELTASQEALRDMKIALREGDARAAQNMLNKFVALNQGIKTVAQMNKSVSTSLLNMDPLNGLNKKPIIIGSTIIPSQRDQFIQTLTPDQRATLQRAYKFYKDVLVGAGKQLSEGVGPPPQ